ncbi:hypothetical protein MIDIC_330036 [Alphaproteobacteria bacterium]
MKITTKELKICIDQIFNYLEDIGMKELSFKNDMYWYIPRDFRYDVYNTPKSEDLTIGQISWDISALKKLIDKNSMPTSYHLVWLSAVLRTLGDEM